MKYTVCSSMILQYHHPFFHSDSKGEVRQEIYNKNVNPQYKLFYYDDESVVESIRQAQDLLTAADRTSEL